MSLEIFFVPIQNTDSSFSINEKQQLNSFLSVFLSISYEVFWNLLPF